MSLNVVSPKTTEELLEVIAKYQDKKFRFGAGYTDLLLDIKKQGDEDITIINLAYLSSEQFTSIKKTNQGLRLGALVTANTIIINPILSEEQQLDVLRKSANRLASRQIRQVATLGGNLCTASPAGDISCALVALQAQCEILSANGDIRVIPIDDFFVGVRQTDLKKDEILRSVFIKSDKKNMKVYSDFIKIGTRRSMECAVISIAYNIHVDKDDTITHAGLAIGSVAPAIKFVRSACEYLVGRDFFSIGVSESEEFACRVLEYASPISDIRASAWYRKEVLFNISKSIFNNR